MSDAYFDKVVGLCDYTVKSMEPRMKWTWGEALLGYGLSLMGDFLGDGRYDRFLAAYCDYWSLRRPRVASSDTAAPGLVTYSMWKKTGDERYRELTDSVLSYIRGEPRLIGDAVNHLGSSPLARIYPKSIWVDSLMMFSVFPAMYARENGDSGLLDFAARQPRLYAGYLEDPETGLWYHSYWVKAGTHYPRSDIFWGRGNGWVVAALPMILGFIGADHPEAAGMADILRRTSEALLPLQRGDGAFETVLSRPGKTYRELSATALIASGWMRGVRMGILDGKFLSPALSAFKAVVGAFREGGGGVFMPEISGPTIPLPPCPYLGYRLVPRAENWSYGIAAAIFAAIEYASSPGVSAR
jgi:unsaturated rhamnogalacturonyl hydrolase